LALVIISTHSSPCARNTSPATITSAGRCAVAPGLIGSLIVSQRLKIVVGPLVGLAFPFGE
jgi:hypothetical protein